MSGSWFPVRIPLGITPDNFDFSMLRNEPLSGNFRRELDQLERIAALLEDSPLCGHIHLDFSVINDMDEALILSAVDFSGRSYLGYDLNVPAQKVGTFDTELAQEFWLGFVRNANCTLHIRQLAGENSHHILEGSFKSVARSLRTAVKLDPDCAGEIPSTKGML